MAKGFFRKYGFGLILLAMFLFFVSAYWNQTYAYTRSEAEMNKVEWSKDDQETEFWNGLHENMQSEFAQLFVQFMGMVAFASWVSAKEDESQEENAYKGTMRALRDHDRETG